jgi:hypothetical protein
MLKRALIRFLVLLLCVAFCASQTKFRDAESANGGSTPFFMRSIRAVSPTGTGETQKNAAGTPQNPYEH